MKIKINKIIGALILTLGLLGVRHLNAQTLIQPNSTTFICQNTVSSFQINATNGVGCMVNSKSGPGSYTFNPTGNNTFTISITGQLNVVIQTLVVQGYASYVQINSYGLFISGLSVLCPPTTATYTNSGQGIYGTLSWSFPPFMSGTPGYNPTKPQPVTDNSNGTGNIVLTATGSVCPAGNASNICVFPVISGAPAMPSSVHYIQETNQCYFNPYVAAESAATDYQWSTSNFPNGVADDEGGTPRSQLEFLPNTHVTMYVRSSNSCGTSPTRMTTMNTPPTPPGCVYRINETTGIAPVKEIKEVNVYPNPAGNMFKLDLPGTDNKVEVRILNMEGALVKSFTTSESTLEVGTEDMPSGLYIIQLQSASYHEIKKIQILK